MRFFQLLALTAGLLAVTAAARAQSTPKMARALPGAVEHAPDAPTLSLTGAGFDLKDVAVNSDHVYDYTFSTAPVDWRVAAGVWEMTNRWSCSPGWSWFGGRSDEVAAIWNKRKVGGDVSAQMYFAFKMGLNVAQWPEYPSDAALTICGDGQNLGSGYVFIAGAKDNTCSLLMKNGEVVARSDKPEALLPRLTDGKPGNDSVHRRWWYSRLDKVGNVITASLDGKPVLTYTDAAPLDGGQTAIWTYNNGLMLARVQLYFERDLSASWKTPLRVAAAK